MGKKFYEVDIKYSFWSDFLTNHFETVLILILAVFLIPADIRTYYFLFFGIYIIYLIASIIYKAKKTNSTAFKIYDDKIIYEMNFLKQERQEIFYKDMKDLKYSQKQISSLFNVGEIIIVKKDGNIFTRRLVIKGIKNHKEVVQKLEETIMEYAKKNNLIEEKDSEDVTEK